MSRKDEIWRDQRGIITIAGGKLTGFRLMAAAVMTHVADSLERELPDQVPLATLPGGDLLGRDLSADDNDQDVVVHALDSEIRRIGDIYQLSDTAAGRLVRLYGSEDEAVLGAHPTLISNSVFAEEVNWALEVDGALSL